jgi:mRNA interferase RelE/StbE
MSYTILILRRAQKELAGLSSDAYQNVVEAIQDLCREPRPPGCRKLTGRDGWRIRVGDYRLIYEIADDRKVVTVLHVRHRRDVYK